MKRAIVMIMAVVQILCAEKLIMQMDLDCNEVGDATVTWTQKATAFQWKLLMQKYGNNPALLKKEIVYSLPNYDLSDFRYKKDEMNRVLQFSFKAKGVVVNKGDGKWHFAYEKGFTPRKIDDRTWLFTNTTGDGGLIEEAYITLRLPPNAKNAHLTKDEYDEPVLEYVAKPSFWVSVSWLTIAGVVILVTGLILLVYGFFGAKDEKAGEATPQGKVS